MPPNHDNTERQNRTLCDGYQRAQRDHVHVAGKVQDEKIKHVQGRAENDGIICVFKRKTAVFRKKMPKRKPI